MATANQSQSRKTSKMGTMRILIFCIFLISVLSFFVDTSYHFQPQQVSDTNSQNGPNKSHFAPLRSEKTSTKTDKVVFNKEIHTYVSKESHKISGLSCEKFGGPPVEIAQEIVYWSDIASDSKVSSPFRDGTNPKYLTFEPDQGGWNNIRMAMETVLVLAHAMGRTLVLPPEAKMYLLSKSSNAQKNQFSFNDFFHLDSLDKEHEGLDIITMEEFLIREGSKGNLKDSSTLKPLKPPGGVTDWNRKNLHALWTYLRKVGYVLEDWDPNECTAAIPASKNAKDILDLKRMMEEINSYSEEVNPENFKGKPFPVNAPAIDRLKENSCGRKKLCIYDKDMQDTLLLHFQVGSNSSKKLRLLTHFYSFIFFQDWKYDLWAKRFVRDHLRYTDEIMCAGARLVHEVRKKSHSAGKGGLFHSLHVRRGDFQYKKTRIDADDLLRRSQRHLEKGSIVYIATDEKDKTFFRPLAEYYKVYFMNDFSHVLNGINTNYFGMIDQLVASKGEKFIGTWWSTLSGYINRMRGYHSVKNKLPGSKDGIINSWYFIPDQRQDEMQVFWPVRKPLYMREFPTSWRDIDEGV